MERLRYLPEKALTETGIFKVGVVVMVVNRKGEVWVGQESKRSLKGQLAPLCETRKQGEFIWQNTQAALVEEMGVTQKETNNFYWDNKVSYVGRFPFPEGNKPIHADIVLILYTGNQRSFQSRSEVAPVGWMKSQELLSIPVLRHGPKPALEYVLNHGLIERLLSSEGKKRAILEGIDPEEFYQQRLLNEDIYNEG